MSEADRTAKERLAARRKAAAKKRRRKKRLVGLGALLVLVLIAVIAVTDTGRTPAAVTGLTCEPCYAEMDLTWDKTPGAAGYYIYASDGDGFERVGDTEGADACSYAFTDYERGRSYEFRVSGYSRNILTGKVKEGEQSDTVSAVYDSSKYAQKIPILTYHKIVPAGTEFDTGLLIAEDTFEEHMKWLHDEGYTTLTPDEFYEWHEGKREFPPKTVMVTFDDGYYGTYWLAYPIIKKYGQACTVFCIGKNTDGVTDQFDPDDHDKDHYVKQDVIEKTREEYPRFCFESHTFDMHNRVDGKKPAVSFTYDQIMEDCKKNGQFGFRYLAYPWGTYSDTMIQALKDSGYRMAFAYRPFYYALRSDDTYAVNRVKISGKISMDGFIRYASGEREDCDNPDAPENR